MQVDRAGQDPMGEPRAAVNKELPGGRGGTAGHPPGWARTLT